ncbi:MBL fold metallo-hydrolase [Bacillus glycinifermentans]|uniref:MBL fold metallo-hydrolase n=1 Tax=Bacillus glycinifermentans TaxID=1664069 RepID=UPI001FF3A831|nr:MBL fold metallo-hydrolase [Bacillus glycinifermentans]MEC3608606.1 MBL fold metallo-hydrolase [Bacillus glycinifermentans]UOY88165.1 MBL fold metallo-hydrolase [Bacillus glycinifermentans]
MSDSYMPLTSVNSGVCKEYAKGVYGLTVQIVNVFFILAPSGDAVLIDCGMPKSASFIIKEAEKLLENDRQLKAIILTHGHFDHVGALEELLDKWQVPVYVHPEEMPYVTGKADYPPAKPEAKSGLVAKLSPLFPRHSINVSSRAKPLKEDGSVPFLEDWRWIATPGHTPGHISLFRESDKTLVAGDAVTTVEQESLFEVAIQKQELNGPPAYFTMDWLKAGESIRQLAELKPASLLTGHGVPMKGADFSQELSSLADSLPASQGW